VRITATRATKRFGSRVVFADFDAQFRSGVLTALVGPSGSGKTTLLAAMAGFMPLSSGSVRFHTEQGRSLPAASRHVSWVPQGSNSLPARTVIDNVLMGPLAAGLPMDHAAQLSRDALDRLGLLPFASRITGSLSGGELQRVCLARAVASQRPCIFADEPSANLDAATTAMLAQLLGELPADRIVVIATHDPALVEAVDDIVTMRPASLGRTTAVSSDDQR
jgi:putative ABC transport system ATP-binding protein